MDIAAYIIAVLVFGIIGGAIIMSTNALYDIRESIQTIEDILSEDKQHD